MVTGAENARYRPQEAHLTGGQQHDATKVVLPPPVDTRGAPSRPRAAGTPPAVAGTDTIAAGKANAADASGGTLRPGEPATVTTLATGPAAPRPAEGAGAQSGRGRVRDGWVTLSRGDGTAAASPDPAPARQEKAFLSKPERAKAASAVAGEVWTTSREQMQTAPTLTEFLRLQSTGVTYGFNHRIEWIWGLRPQGTTAEEIFEGSMDEANTAKLTEQAARIESLQQRIDALEPQEGMVRVAVTHTVDETGGFPIPQYKVLATFPAGEHVTDPLDSQRTEDVRNAKRQAKERGSEATVYFEQTSPCMMQACGDFEDTHGEQAFYVPFQELKIGLDHINGIPVIDGKLYYVSQRAADGTPLVKENTGTYLLIGLMGGLPDDEFQRVRVSDFAHYRASAADGGGSQDTDARGQQAGQLAPGEPAQLADAAGGDGAGNGLPTENGEAGDEHKREVVERVRGMVNEALRDSFGRDTVTAANYFQGMLSVNPDELDPFVTEHSLLTMCYTFSEELQTNLAERQLSTVVSISTREDGNKHNYLVANVEGVEVLIDASIGQFIKGHNHTFVGTREQLYDLVMNQTGDEKPYTIINTSSYNNPQEAFERIWGIESKPFFEQTEA